MNRNSKLAISLAVIAVSLSATSSCTSERGGYKTVKGSQAPAPKDFFSDTAEGRQLEGGLDVGLKSLQSLEGASASAQLKDRTVIYAGVFNAFSQDLRAVINAYFNGVVLAGGTSEQIFKALPEYNRLVSYAFDRTSRLQAFQVYVEAYKSKPEPSKLDVLGENLKALLNDAAANYPGKPEQTIPIREQTRRIEIGGLDRLMDNALGNSEHPRGFWQYESDGSARMVTPIVLSGGSRITGNLDKTPFMERGRVMRLELRNIDELGKRAFACFVKSDITLGSDGDRLLEVGVVEANGLPFKVAKAEGGDRAYYLAWRGKSMTMEEFARRYPGAEVVLTVEP